MTGTTVNIRPAVLTDRADVWQLVRAFAETFQPEQNAFNVSFEKLLAANRSLVLVADESARGIVGYLMANAHVTFLENGPVIWVEEIMVGEQERRSGIGRSLMAGAEQWGRSFGATYIALASRRAGAFYLALGYEDAAVFYKKTIA
jgi:GNAT superfamily N-acetyltransferase